MRTACVLLLVASLARAQDGGLPAKEFERMAMARMLNSQRARMQTLREQLREPLTPDACERGKVFRSLYKPSFARPSVITLEVSPGQARLSLRAPTRFLADGGFEFTQVETQLAPEVSGPLVTALEAGRPRELSDQPQTGTDGITLLGTVCAPGEPAHHFIGWSEDTPRRREWFRALVDASRASLPQFGAFTAESTLEYLAAPGELIYADLPGPPRTLRLVGISVGEAEPFRALVKSVKSDEDLIIDLRNFSGAGTMFKPEFMQLDRRKGRTVWVAHPELAKDLVKRFGVARVHFVDSLELAQKRLTR